MGFLLGVVFRFLGFEVLGLFGICLVIFMVMWLRVELRIFEVLWRLFIRFFLVGWVSF